jgi:hypothetical protein
MVFFQKEITHCGRCCICGGCVNFEVLGRKFKGHPTVNHQHFYIFQEEKAQLILYYITKV